MDLRFDAGDESFRSEARTWLEDNLAGEFAEIRHRGGPGDEHAFYEERLAWERHMGAAGWTCLAWPQEYGGRDLDLTRQVIFHEEYARAGGPGRLGHIGETLAGPTVIAFGTEDQKQRILPPIARGDELWCQGYSEPDAGSDLANVKTRAVRDGDDWVLDGQKVWTSLAHWADWCFVLARTDTDAPTHKGITYFLVPMRQGGIEIRPINQITGDSEFNEVFFDGARTSAANVVGDVDGGWKVAMGTLAFERGASTLGQQMQFRNELARIVEIARTNGSADDPVLRGRLVAAWSGLEIMRWNALRVLSGAAGSGAAGSGSGAELAREGLIAKLYWGTWHRELGNLAMDVLGAAALVGETAGGLTALQRMFLFSRSDTIYAGSNQIQRNIIGERALGLPREPQPPQ